jgi:hypothetical protein
MVFWIFIEFDRLMGSEIDSRLRKIFIMRSQKYGDPQYFEKKNRKLSINSPGTSSHHRPSNQQNRRQICVFETIIPTLFSTKNVIIIFYEKLWGQTYLQFPLYKNYMNFFIFWLGPAYRHVEMTESVKNGVSIYFFLTHFEFLSIKFSCILILFSKMILKNFLKY